MKFSIEEILKGTDSEIRSVNNSKEATDNQESEKSFIKEIEHQTVDANQRQDAYGSSRIMDDDLEESIHRRARTTIAAWQRQELECLFTKYRYPTFEKVEHLSEQLGLPQYVIKVWFQNRRAKYRKESRRRTKNLTIAAVRHFSALQRMPLPLRVVPQRLPPIPTAFGLHKSCDEGARIIETPARRYDVTECREYIPLQQNVHDSRYECYQRRTYSTKIHENELQTQRSSKDAPLAYNQGREEYYKHQLAFMGQTDGNSNEKCHCMDCERN